MWTFPCALQISLLINKICNLLGLKIVWSEMATENPYPAFSYPYLFLTLCPEEQYEIIKINPDIWGFLTPH